MGIRGQLTNIRKFRAGGGGLRGNLFNTRRPRSGGITNNASSPYPSKGRAIAQTPERISRVPRSGTVGPKA